MSDSSKSSDHKSKNRQQIICSTLSSITKVLIVQPFDFLRYRIQSSFEKSHNITSTIRKMSTSEGLSIFLKATTVTTVGVFISSFSVFYFYQKGRELILDNFNYFRNEPFCHQDTFKIEEKDLQNSEATQKALKAKLFKVSILASLGGVYSGIFTTLLTLPTDNVRIRIQAMQNIKELEFKSYNFEKPRDSIIDIYNRSGIRGFYIATGPSLAREMVAGFFYFGFFEYLKNRHRISQIKYSNIHHLDKINNLPIHLSFLFGSLGGVINWCVTLPIDHVKTKLISDNILHTQKFNGVLDCVMKTYYQFGIRGFYTGFSIILIRAVVVNGAVITVFDRCRKAHL